MNVESASSFESLGDNVNNGALIMQQLLAPSEQIGAASDQSVTDLVSIDSTDHLNYCEACLDHTHPTSKGPYIINL